MEEQDNLDLCRVIANLHPSIGDDSPMTDSSPPNPQTPPNEDNNENNDENLMARPDYEIAWKLNFWLEKLRDRGWEPILPIPALGEVLPPHRKDENGDHEFMCTRFFELLVGLLPFRPGDHEGDPLAWLRVEDRKRKGGVVETKRVEEGSERAVAVNSESRFLALPRELRDAVYEFAVQEYDLRHRFGGTYRVVVKDGMISALLRSCRQIAMEYGPIVRKKQTLVLSDRFLPEVFIRSVKISCEPLRWMRRMEVFLFAHCEACTNDEAVPHVCQVCQEVEEHAVCVARIVRQMQQLESLEIRVDVAWPKKKGLWPKSPHRPRLKDSLEDLVQGGVTKVLVHRRREALKKESRADKVAGRNDDLFAVWDTEGGWQGAKVKTEEPMRKETRSDSVIDMEENA